MRYLPIIYFSIAAFLISCEGPVGPQGPQGNTGPQGNPGQEGFTFEYTVDFVAPDYESFLELPSTFQMLESDVALVYFLWGTTEENGETVEVWRQIPQNLFLEEGILQYNFDHTIYSIRVFLDATFDRAILGANYTDDWIVRVVVVPAQFEDNGRVAGVDFSDYNAVKEHFNLQDMPVDSKYSSIKRPEIK